MWNELLPNDKPLSLYFTDFPSLESVDVHKIVLDRNGPVLGVFLDLSEFPDKPPAKWSRSYNKCKIGLHFVGIECIRIKKWSTNNVADIRLSKSGNTIEFEIIGEVTEVFGRCAAVTLTGVSGYCDGEIES